MVKGDTKGGGASLATKGTDSEEAGSTIKNQISSVIVIKQLVCEYFYLYLYLLIKNKDKAFS